MHPSLVIYLGMEEVDSKVKFRKIAVLARCNFPQYNSCSRTMHFNTQELSIYEFLIILRMKIHTCPLTHHPYLRLCGLHPQRIYRLYTAPHQTGYRVLNSLCRHKQNTMGTSVWNYSYTEGLDYTVSWEKEPYI